MLLFFSSIFWVIIYLVIFGIDKFTAGLINSSLVHLSRSFYLPYFLFNLIACFGFYSIIVLSFLLLFGNPMRSLDNTNSLWYGLIPYAFIRRSRWPLLFVGCALVSSIFSLVLMILGNVNPSFFALTVIILIGMTSNFLWSKALTEKEEKNFGERIREPIEKPKENGVG